MEERGKKSQQSRTVRSRPRNRTPADACKDIVRWNMLFGSARQTCIAALKSSAEKASRRSEGERRAEAHDGGEQRASERKRSNEDGRKREREQSGRSGEEEGGNRPIGSPAQSQQHTRASTVSADRRCPLPARHFQPSRFPPTQIKTTNCSARRDMPPSSIA
eukprot:2968469-Rhodomonas_salina.2